MGKKPNDAYYALTKAPTPPYSLPDKRECHWCHEQKKRSSGRWVTKTTWVCHECKAKENEK